MKTFWQLFLLLFLNSISAQEEKYEVFNTSINSIYAELGTIYLDNTTVLFASSKKNEEDRSFKKDRRKNNRQLHLELYKGTITKNGDIIQNGKFSNNSANPFFESDISFSSDKKNIYFTLNNFYNTQTVKDSAKWKTLRIVKASLNETFEISNITSLPFNNEEYSVRNPQLSKNGKQLYFVSDMPEGFGETDIYVVDINNDGTYGKPKNLGENINTKKSELFPFIDKYSNIYFSSSGYGGNGSLNIYKSEFKDGNYLKAKKLQSPINSEFDDFAFVLNNTGEQGFFTSNREESKGDVDIYAFSLIKPCNQSVTGEIFNKINKEKLLNTKIQLFNNQTLIETLILTDSNFNFNLRCNENYKIVVQKKGFVNTEIQLNTNNNNTLSFTKKIEMSPVICEQLLTGTVLDANTKMPLSNAIITIFEGNDAIDTLNVNASFTYKLKCNTQYRIVASLENYLNDIALIHTSSINNETISKEFLLESNPEFEFVRNHKMIKMKALQFDLDKYDIREDTAEELNKVVDILNKYPNLKLEVKSHTDSRAPDTYNMNISNSRAKSIINYIISKGIDSERITGKGYGETELLNNCSNGVKCTEAEHLVNRRTEFIVTEN